jgi:hypothetical protein
VPQPTAPLRAPHVLCIRMKNVLGENRMKRLTKVPLLLLRFSWNKNVLKLLTLTTILCISTDQHKHKNSRCRGSPKNVYEQWAMGFSKQYTDLICRRVLWTGVNFPICSVVSLQIFESNVVKFWTHNKWWLPKSNSYICDRTLTWLP